MRSKCYVGAAICMACLAGGARAQSAADKHRPWQCARTAVQYHLATDHHRAFVDERGGQRFVDRVNRRQAGHTDEPARQRSG